MALGGVGGPVAAGLAQEIARWLRERGLGAGGTVATPTPTPTPTPAAPVPEDGSDPLASPAAAAPTAAPSRTPQFPNPTSNVERMYNAAQQIQWQIEDVQARLNALDPDQTSARTKLQDDINTLLGRLTSQQQAIAAAERTAVDVSGRNPPKGETRTKVERAPSPDNRLFRITEVSDGYGGWSYQSAEPIEGSQPQGSAEDRALALQRAQVDLERAQQQLADERDPARRQQLQIQVQQAQFALDQARAKGPLDLQTAQLAYDRARTEYEQATDETSRETRRVALEQAQVALEAARQGLARGNAPQVIQTDSSSPYIVTRDPNTGAIKTEPNPTYQGPTFADATAAYNAQVPRLQQAARTERDRLLELQRQGAISEADAEKQFTQWFAGNVETPLAGYRAAAEEAQRKEQRENEALQRAENARVEALNRQREQIGLEAGQRAMVQLAEIAPQIRTPQFLSQFGATVERMGQRAGAQSAEAAAALPSGSTFTKDTFSAEQARPHVPDFNQFAQQATQRALAQISPAVAARIGATPPPPLPQGPTLSSLLQGLPYRGPLAGLPSPASGLQPTPGMDPALDIGGGMARTPYGPGGNVYLDWRLPQ